MKRFQPYMFFLFCWLIISSQSFSQNKKDCDHNCFHSNLTLLDDDPNGCSIYEIEVSYSGDCHSDLSHYTVAVPPCATVNNISNSENWKIEEVHPDPTTGLTGFKIDDISNFGKDPNFTSFKVNFTICSDGDCDDLNCWQPVVAYKASTCVAYDTIAAQCNNLEAALVKKDLSCFESNDGEISVVIIDGSEPFTYLWSNSETVQDINGLSAGEYSVVISDSNGQEIELSAILNQPGEILVDSQITPSSCSGINNGGIDITVSGGSGSYSYSWSNGATSEDINQLASGSYSVVVTDSIGCTATSSFIVESESTITISGAISHASCAQSNGSIDISVFGGEEPYMYQWSNGATTQDISDLAPGNYNVAVTDSQGCQSQKSFKIGSINTLIVGANVTKASCNEDAGGAIDIAVSGGTAPYSYEWSNGETTEDLSDIGQGDYSVTVTDAEGCSRTLRLFVSRERIGATAQVIKPSCFGEDTGSIIVTPLTGTAPYTYEWSNGSTNNELTDLVAGLYSVTITDATGCSSTYNYLVGNPTQLSVSFSVNNYDCGEEGSYEIDLEVQGGTSPYTYEWSNGEESQDLTGLSSGSYQVIITDANGCSVEKDIVVDSNPIELNCLIDAPIDNIICNSVDNQLSSSTEADSYSWEVISSDSTWVITSGSDSSRITFNAGNPDNPALFILTVSKDGCEKTCSFELQACSSDNDDNGDGDDGDGTGDDGDGTGGDDGGTGDDDDGDDDENCGGYSSEIMLVNADNDCYSYEVVVHSDGTAKHGLSHFTMDIPCGNISDASNSAGWKIELGSKDPTSGLWGLKVDDINGFGESNTQESFTINFTICSTDQSCVETLQGWEAVAAYKAGQCVTYDSLEIENNTSSGSVSYAYPNPFSSNLTIDIELDKSNNTSLDIYNQQGELMQHIFDGSIQTTTHRSFNINTDSWPDGIYFYHLVTDNQVSSTKLLLVR